MLRSMLALPVRARMPSNSKFYNKLGALPFPRVLEKDATMVVRYTTPHQPWARQGSFTIHGPRLLTGLTSMLNVWQGYHTMVQNLRAAAERGWTYIDPRRNLAGQPPLSWGAMTNRYIDKIDFCWCSAEKDWLVWLLAHNVTVEDIGTEVRAVLFHGEHLPRLPGEEQEGPARRGGAHHRKGATYFQDA